MIEIEKELKQRGDNYGWVTFWQIEVRCFEIV